MAIYSLSELKGSLGIADGDVSQDVTLSGALKASQAAVESYCKRQFERATRTAYPRSDGMPEITLEHAPVRCYSLAGSATSGDTTVTGLSSTADLVAGMPVVHADIPAGTTVSTIASSTSVTISAATTAAISAGTLVFGLEVWLDTTGRYGDGADAFPSSSRLTLGTDFELERDRPDGCSGSGVIRRLGGGPVSSLWDWPAWGGTARGNLTARAVPAWPRIRGGVKVVYTAGYAAADVPADLKQAIHQLAVFVWMTLPRGGMVVGNESISNEGGSYSYALTKLREAPEVVEARGILRNYRRVVI